ncbi:unnamed protein product [Nyctereutes procyonoides]|uniref:(raccoon dog) hypothetical protein n=1 Tax=Nyctereutes procyonoides TaxID=34880 RepID=A0A811YIT0_NYCPR|nr:unnamed protein product [Nyctereutes procyonoides]
MRLPSCLLVQTDARPHGGDAGLHRASRGPRPPCRPPRRAGHRGSRRPRASACRGRPRSAARPLLLGPRPRPRLSRFGPRAAGPLQPLVAQPPPKPGEVESGRRRCLRGTRRAALGMLTSPASLLVPWTPGRPGSAGGRAGQRQRQRRATSAAAAAAASAAGARGGVRGAPRSRRRAGGAARGPRAHSGTCVPLACRRPPSFPRQPGLGRAWARETGSEGSARVGAAERTAEGGRRRAGQGAHPLALAPASAARRAAGLPSLPGRAARSCRGLAGGAGSSGVPTLAAGRPRGKVHFPLAGTERLS